LENFQKKSDYAVLSGKWDVWVYVCVFADIFRFWKEPAAMKMTTRRRSPSPSAARKKTVMDARGPDPVILSALPVSSDS
jgi:hypothetical protein